MPIQNPKTVRHFTIGGVTVGLLLSIAQMVGNYAEIKKERPESESGIPIIVILIAASVFSITEIIPACTIYGASAGAAINLLKGNAPREKSKLMASGLLLIAALMQTINIIITAISTSGEINDYMSLGSSWWESTSADPAPLSISEVLLTFEDNYFNTLTFAVYLLAALSCIVSFGVPGRMVSSVKNCGHLFFKHNNRTGEEDEIDLEVQRARLVH